MEILKKKAKENNEVESTRGYYFKTPDTDIIETKNEYKLIFDLPGIDKDDVKIKIEKDILSLTAECKKEPVEGYECINDEMDFEGYTRSFNLNGTVNTDAINAEYKNGSLYLTLPKIEEQKSKEIEVKIS